jgi:hypothetical protein
MPTTTVPRVHGADNARRRGVKRSNLCAPAPIPWFVPAWLVAGGLVVALAPGVARRIGIALTSELGRRP